MTAAIAVIVDIKDRIKEQQRTQQPTIDRSVGGAVTLVEAAAIVTAEARGRVWWRRRHRRQRRWRQRQ